MSTATPINHGEACGALGTLTARTAAYIAADFRRRMALKRLDRDFSPAAMAENDEAVPAFEDARRALFVAWLEFGRTLGVVENIETFQQGFGDGT